jgi:hypothetical protein
VLLSYPRRPLGGQLKKSELMRNISNGQIISKKVKEE